MTTPGSTATPPGPAGPPGPSEVAPSRPAVVGRAVGVATAVDLLALLGHAAAPDRITEGVLLAVVLGWAAVVLVVAVGLHLDPTRPAPAPAPLGRWVALRAPVLPAALTACLALGRGWADSLVVSCVACVLVVLLPELVRRAGAARRARREAERSADR